MLVMAAVAAAARSAIAAIRCRNHGADSESHQRHQRSESGHDVFHDNSPFYSIDGNHWALLPGIKSGEREGADAGGKNRQYACSDAAQSGRPRNAVGATPSPPVR
jgi:hypothetical protein